MRRRFLSLCFLLLCGIATLSAAEDQKAILLTINGAIGPATQDYLHRGFEQATSQHAQFILIQIDTPGGLDQSMRQIIKDIIASPIPVVSFVYPGGARAASAGTFILYASHIAAMAPGTNLGAASPVSIGGGGIPGTTGAPDNKKSKPSTDQQDILAHKIKEDTVAYIRSLAELRGRNADWAEQAVVKAASIPSSKALTLHVIDLIAQDIPDLLKQLNGKKIIIQDHQFQFNTTGLVIEKIEPDWRSRILATITDPSVAYILLLVGVYGLFFEFVNPGFALPGVVGGICLLLALYAFQLLPINYAGLGLLLLGIAFMIGEAFVPSFGVLGIGGVIAFAVGSVLLLDTTMLNGGIPWSLIIVMTIINAVFFFAVISLAIKARRRKIVSGKEAIIGEHGLALENFSETGYVKIKGEIWKATTTTPLIQGQEIIVCDRAGMMLSVEPVTK